MVCRGGLWVPTLGILNQAWYHNLNDRWNHKQRSLGRPDRCKNGRAAHEELWGGVGWQGIIV